MSHTPTPWHTKTPWRAEKHMVYSGGQAVASTDQTGQDSDEQVDADAAFIVKAVNAHDDLLKAAKKALKTAESWIHDQLDGTSSFEGALKDLESVRKAIAKAEGR